MKKILGLLFLMAVALVTSATEFPLAWSANTINQTLLSATTNQTGAAVFVEGVKYHTFVIVNATTRTNTVTLSGSLDSTNWIPFSYTTNTAIATSAVTATGKWSYLRAQVSGLTGTDCNTVIQYLGGN